jgi:aryl-alcohol dehydrogenase-like predicted oxidoreductase
MSAVSRTELASGYTIASVINGCWQLTPDHGGGPASKREIFATFAERVEHGFTTFDCADIYLGVEETIGEFRRQLPDPAAIEVHTKFVPDRSRLHALRPEDVDAAIDRSRRRLATDCLDLVQFHWWRYEIPGLEMMVDRLCELQATGRIRLLGTTNFDTAHIEAMLGRGAPIVSLQAQYSLLDRRPERRMTALAGRSGVRLLPYGVLAGGFLSERHLGTAPPEAGAAGNRSLTKYRLIIEEAGGWDAFQQLLAVLRNIARRHDVSLSTVAARWVLDQAAVPAIILGTGRRPRTAEHLAIMQLRLDEQDRRVIAAQLAAQPIPPGDMYALERDPAGVHAGIIKTDLNTSANGAVTDAGGAAGHESGQDGGNA